MRGRFVGREVELELLSAILAQSSERPGPAAGVVIGAPGSGKSRLLNEVIAHTSRPVLRVIGYEAEQGVPLTAARDLLRELTQRGDPGDQLRETAFGGQAWGQSTPLRLFEATHRSLAEVAPFVLWVDDVQWLDDVSVALLSYLLRAGEADATPMALLAGGRPSATTGKLRNAVLATLSGTDLHAEMELGPLPEAAGVAMVRALKPAASVADAARIWHRAAGSPFWIEALAITGEAHGDSLNNRFGQLGGDAVAVLQALALIARPSDMSELARLLDWPAQRVESAVAELSGRGLAIERPGSIETAHDLIRETARRQVPISIARRLATRLAAQLWRTADGDVRQLREALDHALAAGESGLDIAVDLAGAAQRRLIGADGVRELVRIAEGADPTNAFRQALERRLAELATELGERPLEVERWLAVAEHDDPLTRAGALLAAARAAYRMGRRDQAAELVARARRANVDDAAIGIALDALQSEILRWLDHRLPEARTLTDRALQGAADALDAAPDGRRAIDPRLRSACLEALEAASDLALQEGNEGDQARFAEEIVGLAEGELERMEAQLLLASSYRRSGRMTEAEQRLYPSVMVTAGHHLARALYSLGRVEEAERVAGDAERLSARIGLTGRYLSEVRNLRPGITVSRGDWRAGIARLRADIEREPDPHYKLGIQQEIATWLARLAGSAETDEVRAQIAAARANLAVVGCPRCGRELALRSAEALARIGDLDAARQAVTSQVGQQSRHSREGRLFLGQAIGALLLASGRSAHAAAALGRLGARPAAAGMHREALWADLDRAAALSARDPDVAVRIYRSVADRARAWGVLTDLQVAQQRLRELGARVAPPRPAPGPLGLSRRELEVARMAASGASNPEIAATLFLSRKTVERHVSAALAKVGARNRTELASRLAALEATAAQN
jgi:DNA-binding CsgD family transcriptional regulator/tetratricopeptide (TPR) repeat protein